MISEETRKWTKIMGECRKTHGFYVIDRGMANCKITGDLCSDRNCPKMEIK